MHRAFTSLDRNHDGVIDAEELNALFLDMGHKAKKVITSAIPVYWLRRPAAVDAVLCSLSRVIRVDFLVQTEIEDMIWEVDEDCDQGLNWAEFQAMYHRCNNDKTGEQPVLLICCLLASLPFSL